MVPGSEEEGDVRSYISIVLLRKFKCETGEIHHLTPFASTIDSGIEVIKSIVLLMLYLAKKGINNVLMFQNEGGDLVPIAALDVVFHEVLEKLRNRTKKLIVKGVGIDQEYSI